MILVSRPSTPGASQDAYDALEAVFGGGDFDRDEAVNTLQTTLQMSGSQASSTLSRLCNDGSISD